MPPGAPFEAIWRRETPLFEPIRRAGRGRHAWGLMIAEVCMSWSLGWLCLRLKDLRHFLAGSLREHFRWVRGGSKVGENRPSARSVDFSFTSMPHSPKEETREDRRRSGRSTSRTVRGGSHDETPGGEGDGGPADFVAAARHCMIPGEGAGVGEMAVPALPAAAQNLCRPRSSLQD